MIIVNLKVLVQHLPGEPQKKYVRIIVTCQDLNLVTVKYKSKVLPLHSGYKNRFYKLTRRTATVPLQHHRTPPENSEGMLFLLRTCLKSDSFSSFIKAVWWPATYNGRMSKFLLYFHIFYHSPIQISNVSYSENNL